jgi:hypothetical protein
MILLVVARAQPDLAALQVDVRDFDLAALRESLDQQNLSNLPGRSNLQAAEEDAGRRWRSLVVSTIPGNYVASSTLPFIANESSYQSSCNVINPEFHRRWSRQIVPDCRGSVERVGCIGC